MIKLAFDTSSIQSFLKDAEQDLNNAVRPAAQAGAELLYRNVLARVPVYTRGAGHWFYGSQYQKSGKKYWFNAGSLKRSIYQVHAKSKSSEPTDKTQKHTYEISWNRTEAPYGHMIEFGAKNTTKRKAKKKAKAIAQALSTLENGNSKTNGYKFLGRGIADYGSALKAAENRFYKELKVFR